MRNQCGNLPIKYEYMITTLHFKYGFIYKDVWYGWNNKKLYRLPYVKSNRSYGLKEIPFYVFKTTIVYNIQRVKLTINKLKTITIEVDLKTSFVSDSNCPF